MSKVNKYDLVAQNPQSTVVAEYTPEYGKTKKRAEHYQSEAELEQVFIAELEAQAYERLGITSEDGLKENLRVQLEKLNDYTFSNAEWEQFFVGELANPNQSIAEKTTTIQEDYIKNFTREDGTVKNIYLLDKKNIHNNYLQVINQYAVDEGKWSNRYDVTVLVNGLPLVHIELKRRGVAIQEAFNQINRYQRESFWAASGLFEYVQLFVITNGTHTKYYSNTTRSEHLKEISANKAKKGKRSSNSFEFTSWWADATNKPITDLMDKIDIPEDEMNNSLDQTRFEYAWRYFDFHAKQRTTMLNFFIALSTVLIGVCTKLFTDAEYVELFIFSLVGAYVTYCFMRIDWRNEELIHTAEDELRALEYMWLYSQDHFKHEVMFNRRDNLGKEKKSYRDLKRGIFRKQDDVQDKDRDEATKHCHGRWIPRLHWAFLIFYAIVVICCVCGKLCLWCSQRG